MATIGTCDWDGTEFSIHENPKWNNVAGVYIFAGKNEEGLWVALYIGQASSLAERLANHEQWQEAQRLGATHVHAKSVSDDWERERLERDLIQSFQPRLNVQLRGN